MDREGPLRVFHLIKGLGRGGAEMLLSEGLRCADRERFVYGYGYFLPWKDHLVEDLSRQGADVRCFEARSAGAVLAASRRVARYLRRWRADLMHCHLPLSGIAGRLAGRLAGVPVVYTEHNLMERYHPLTRRANCLTWRLQEAAIAVSPAVAESIAARVDPQVPVQVILNGVNLERFRPEPESGVAIRGELGIPADAPLAGTVAVFRRQKRLDRWLDVAAWLLEQLPDCHFMIVGDGPLRSEVEAAIEERRLGERVHLPGLRDDVRPYLSAMDLYLSSSEFEGLPIAILEAMAMEVPVAATAVGGIPRVVVAGETGMLVPPGDLERLRAAALQILSDRRTGRRMGAAGRRQIADEFSLERMVSLQEDLYEKVVRSRADVAADD